MKKNSEACLVCGEDLVYFEMHREMECIYCHRNFMTNVACKNGHYICDECHAGSAVRSIVETCNRMTGKDPVEIAMTLMNDEHVHLHGPENHVIVGAALLTAYRNAGGDMDFDKAMREMVLRGSKVPGGACGFWGCCGAAVSGGIFYSIVSGASPMTVESWGNANVMTAKCLSVIGSIGGPRCCKRNAFIAIQQAVPFVAEHLGVQLLLPNHIICTFYKNNKQCIGSRCPFNPVHY